MKTDFRNSSKVLWRLIKHFLFSNRCFSKFLSLTAQQRRSLLFSLPLAGTWTVWWPTIIRGWKNWPKLDRVQFFFKIFDVFVDYSGILFLILFSRHVFAKLQPFSSKIYLDDIKSFGHIYLWQVSFHRFLILLNAV